MAYQVKDNLGIDDATVGMSVTKLETYRQELRFSVINQTKDQLRDYKPIVDEISKHWNGRSAQKFVNNLDRSIEKACDALDSIEDAIDAIFKYLFNSMVRQDEEMIDDGDIPFK